MKLSSHTPSNDQNNFVTLCSLWLALLLPSMVFAQDGSLGDGLLVVSDFQPTGKVRIVDPTSGEIVFDYPMSAVSEEGCGRSSYCFPTGLQTTHYGDEDYLDMAITVAKPRGDSPKDKFYSIVQRVKPSEPPVVEWSVKNLIFSNLPNADFYCPQSPKDVCTIKGAPACRMAFAEGFRIIDDNPLAKTVSMVVADGINGRVVGVTLDYNNGNSCGVVDWVLGGDHPQWPVSEKQHPIWPNGVEYVVEGDRRYLIVNFFTTAEEESDPLGAAQIHTFVDSGNGWELAWKFPNSDAAGFLNTPHMAEILEDPTNGERALWYSHSRGFAEDWNSEEEGYGASFVRMTLGNSLATPPTYQSEIGFFEGERVLNFTRDQDYLADGTLLLTDAACQNICDYEPVIYHIDPAFMPSTATNLSGSYTSTHENQRLVQIPDSAILGEYRCGFGALFEAEWLPGDTLGQSLRAAKDIGGRSCEAASVVY